MPCLILFLIYTRFVLGLFWHKSSLNWFIPILAGTHYHAIKRCMDVHCLELHTGLHRNRMSSTSGRNPKLFFRGGRRSFEPAAPHFSPRLCSNGRKRGQVISPLVRHKIVPVCACLCLFVPVCASLAVLCRSPVLF